MIFMKHFRTVCLVACCCLCVNILKAQTATKDNKLFKTITFHSIPKGPSVEGVFAGRPPCAGIVQQLKLTTDRDCAKLKCSVTLYRDSLTFQPAYYILSIVGGGDIVQQDGGSYRQKTLQGRWSIVRGTKSNSAAEVYSLQLGTPGDYLYLLKGDNNVLFILDSNKALMTGNEDFSYTLNRVELVAGKK